MKYPAVEKILASAGRAEIDNVTLSYLCEKQLTTDEEWTAWDAALEDVQNHITQGMGDAANDPEFDEMGGLISVMILVNMPLDTKEFPADLVPKFDALCREAFAKYFP